MRLILLLSTLLPATMVFSMERVALHDAISEALNNNHMVKSSAQEHEAAARAVSASRGRYLPHLYLEESAAISNAPTRVFMMKLDEGRFAASDFQIDNLNNPTSRHDFRTALTLEMPIIDLTVAGLVDMAKGGEAARSHALERRREDAAFQVYASYLAVQKAIAYLQVAEKGVQNAQEHQRLASVRFQSGLGLKSDELRARTFLAEMQQQRLAAANGLTKARMHLALAVGRAGGEQLDAGEPLTPPQLTYGTDELVQLALANRQDLKELEAEQRRAEAGVTTSRSALLPSLYGSATYQMNAENTPFGRDNDSWMAGATLRWDLFNGGSRWNDKERAQAMNRSVQEQVALYREQVKLQVHEGVLQRDEAESRLEMTRSAAEEAEEGARLVQLRYENSLATMVELLDAQMAVNRARAQLVEASADQALATGELYHTAGIFLKEVVQ